MADIGKAVGVEKAGAPARRRFALKLSVRGAFLISAVLVFMLSTLVAYHQQPFNDPYRPPEVLSWQWWTSPQEKNAFLRLPSFPSANEMFHLPGTSKFWLVGDYGLISDSADGGRHWHIVDTIAPLAAPHEKQDAPAGRAWFPGFGFGANVYAASSGTVDKKRDARAKAGKKIETTTAGNSATGPMAPATVEDYESIFFLDAQHGWAGGGHGVIIATRDGGRHWQQQTPHNDLAIGAIHFVEAGNGERHGWAVGEKGTILASRDGGRHWQAQQSGVQRDLRGVQFIDAQRGWAVGDGGTILSTRNGGARWQASTHPGKRRDFSALSFIDADHGWIVGEGGIILATRNGGETWQQQDSGSRDGFESVQFVRDGAGNMRGWITDGNGTLLTTRDGGDRWQRQLSPAGKNLFWVYFSNARDGWAIREDGSMLFTHDGGQHWQWHTRVVRKRFAAMQLLSRNNGVKTGWTVGEYGNLMVTRDGGESWLPLATPVQRNWQSVDFVNPREGWLLGSHNTLLSSRDGGKNWKVQTLEEHAGIQALYFQDPQRGWLAGNRGTILATRDGGQSWQARKSGSKEDLRAMGFAAAPDERYGWAVGEAGTILATADGGETWHTQRRGASSNLIALHVIDRESAWAVGSRGTILATRDGGKSWQQQNSGVDINLGSVWFLDSRHGWVVGDDGIVLATRDGGKSWQPQFSGTREHITALQVVRTANNELHGWLVGEDGSFLTTRDGGQHWKPLVYRKGVAPWYFISWLVVAGLLVPVLRRPKPIELSQQSIANVAISDRPLRSGDPDPLRFQAIAHGLSRFLRNESSEPPVTIAVTGKWGSGKSSLMNLLRADLKRYGTRAVWFNAWHHQRQSQVLAALLDTIRKQAIPSWLTLAGWNFRLRLLWRRGWQKKALAFAVLVMASATVAYLSSGNNFATASQKLKHIWSAQSVELSGSSLNKLKQKFEDRDFAATQGKAQTGKGREGSKDWLILAPLLRDQQDKVYDSKDALYTGLVVASLSMSEQTQQALHKYKYDILLYAEQAGIIGKLQSGEKDLSHDLTAILGGIFGPVFTVLILVLTVWRNVGAFGLNPSVLLKSINGKHSARQLREQTGFRHQFAREFDDVTQALKPYQMVIIIDDLDRCNAEAVLEVLEAVNFLVASGECYVVLGMDMDVVRSCVGLGYEKLAQEMVYELNEQVADPQQQAKENRREFARHYLEKLINIEVPIPMLDSEQSRQLIAPLEDGSVTRPTLRQRLGVAIPRAAQPTRLLAFWLLAIALGVGGYRYFLQPAVELAPRQQASSKALQPDAGRPPAVPGTVASETLAGATDETPTPQRVHRVSRAVATPGQTAAYQHHHWYPVVVALLLAGLLILLRRPDVVVRDSNDFRLALNIWHKVIAAYCHTPRSMKRFINRVRYLAMFQTQSDETHTLSHRGRRLWNWIWNIGPPTPPDPAPRIPEPTLVALSAIQLGQAKRLQGGGREVFDELVAQSGSTQGLDKELHELFHEALSLHMQTFVALAPQGDGERIDAAQAGRSRRGQKRKATEWPPSDEQRREFLQRSEGVRVA